MSGFSAITATTAANDRKYWRFLCHEEFLARVLLRHEPFFRSKNTPLRMYAKLSGPFYLANLWSAVRSAFNLPLPNVCLTMGFPSRRARTRASNRAPGEILVEEWKGEENIEKSMVSIHPERFESVEQVAMATLFVVGNETYGSRRNLGSLTLGIELEKETGNLIYTKDEKGHHAQTTLRNIIRRLGPLPAGFAEMPEPKARQTTRMQKYACTVCGKPIRGAGDLGTVMHSDGGTFALATKTPRGQAASRTPRAQAAPQPTAAPPAPIRARRTTDRENQENLARAVRAGAAKVVHGRQFGVEQIPPQPQQQPSA